LVQAVNVAREDRISSYLNGQNHPLTVVVTLRYVAGMQLRGPVREGAWVEDVLTDVHSDSWKVAVWITERRGRLVVGEIRVFPDAGPVKRLDVGGKEQVWGGTATDVPRRGLERRFLVKVPVGRYVAAVMATVNQAATVPGKQAAIHVTGMNLPFLNKLLPGAEKLAPRPRATRDFGRGDRWYALLAAEYVERLAGGSTSPVKDIAAKCGETAAHIRDWLHEARVRGLLSKGEAGRRGGYLLARARTVLNETPATTRTRRRKR
jgi:hypothetical protein